MKATRADVYRAIDGERDYQDKRWSRPAHNHSATEYLVYIRHYVNLAMTRVSTEDGEDGALENLRKIAALAVAAMEEHGAPVRDVPVLSDVTAIENVVYTCTYDHGGFGHGNHPGFCTTCRVKVSLL